VTGTKTTDFVPGQHVEARAFGRWYDAIVQKIGRTRLVVGLVMAGESLTTRPLRARSVALSDIRSAEGSVERRIAESIVGVVLVDD
jgi:hypothetical protein